ncbi:lipase 1-like [Anopheles ziemanni]|uniref:lipase 1-like n=1 Tax=Anopheles coustani TaxID=139045 RepID=UPI002658F15F|nr:lipase 1-like [Anopheles coustani]XP_058178168.1 lipase 1-like [Anopheles ziemanni]
MEAPRSTTNAEGRQPQITQKYGYSTEVHHVQTEDGYILELHRIRASPTFGPADPSNPPVLLMHGLMGSSADWILIGPEDSLPYLLSDRGHDVWLGNSRGNRYSRNHSRLSPESHEFWDFSFHELGLYDLPAMVDHVLEQSGSERLHYVGHSQGTTMFFVLNALRPEYAKKFRLMQALAPATFVTHLKHPFLRLLVQHQAVLVSIFQTLGIVEIKPFPDDWNRLVDSFCPDFFSRAFCQDTMHSLTGNKYPHLSALGFRMVTHHVPAGCAVKQWVHFGQLVQSGHFRAYDYGPERNRLEYAGQSAPPDYDLARVVVPVAIYYGLADELTQPADVRLLAEKLPNLVALNLLPNATFNHMDFMLASDAKVALYDSIIANVEQP